MASRAEAEGHSVMFIGVWIFATLFTGPIGFILWPLIYYAGTPHFRQKAGLPPEPEPAPPPPAPAAPPPIGEYYDDAVPFKDLPN